MSKPDEKDEPKNNVIQLPTFINEKQLYDAQQSIKYAKDYKREFCEEVLEYTMEHMFHTIGSFGFFMDKQRIYEKDIVLLEMAIASILYRYYNIEHPMHETVESLINIKDAEDGDEDADEVETESDIS